MNQDVIMLLVGVLVILYGVLTCFFGWRIVNAVLAIGGFALGVAIALSITATPATGDTNWIAALIGGVIGAVVIVLLLRLVSLAAGALFGAVVALMIITLTGLTDAPAIVLLLVCIIAGALIGLALQKTIIILATAFGGAVAILAGFALTVPDLGLVDPTLVGRSAVDGIVTTAPNALLSFILWIGLGAVGFIAQYRTSGRWRRRGGNAV
ncbi:MAG: DUF4203 domain-containing protein [Chloroflexota bacterium]|nr:DUF4203 domain-containing protein [Chloroflexota bacterium]